MKTFRLISSVLAVIIAVNTTAQTTVNIYNPNADARTGIAAAVNKAKAENKHVLIQVGGNWCSWCVKMHHLFHSDNKIDSTIKANYVFILVNHSKENKNLPVLRDLDFPQRFGFPVLVILNRDGKRIHTQATDLLESGEGYDNKKILRFLNAWSVKALDPKNYPEQ